MSQQSPNKPESTLLNSQNVPLPKPDKRDLSREAGRIARQLEGLSKAVRRLDERIRQAT